MSIDRSIDLEISIDQSIDHYDRAHPYFFDYYNFFNFLDIFYINVNVYGNTVYSYLVFIADLFYVLFKVKKIVKYLVTLVLNKIELTLPLLIWTFVLKKQKIFQIFLVKCTADFKKNTDLVVLKFIHSSKTS